MPANFNPIFGLNPNITVGITIATANTAVDGTGTVSIAHTAGSFGSLVRRLRGKATGTAVASVLSIFINNGATNTSAGNNSFWDEGQLPAITGTNVASTQPLDLQFNPALVLPSGYRILLAIRTTVANAWAFTVDGIDY